MSNIEAFLHKYPDGLAPNGTPQIGELAKAIMADLDKFTENTQDIRTTLANAILNLNRTSTGCSGSHK